MRKKQIETHGKIETSVPTTLDQIFGFNELSKFGTLEESVYAAKINEMTRTDLEAETRKLGLIIVEATSRLRENLLKEFRNYVTFLHKPTEASKTKINLSDAVKKILNEGR